MGILDDAIREHLDLKRRLGAEDSELARLEDEAFGLPTRPGDPDFPEDKPEAGAETAVAEPPVAEPPSQETPADPPTPTQEEEQIQPAAAQAEPATDDHEVDEPDLDLELDLELEAEPEAPPPAEPPPPPEPPPAEPPAEPPIESLDTVEHEHHFEPPIESLDTVEHHFEGAIEDTGEAEALQPQVEETGEADAVEGPIDDTGEVEVVEGELADHEDSEEDVLEETPEFLRDQPEDDELWFEQGEPKDFDF